MKHSTNKKHSTSKQQDYLSEMEVESIQLITTDPLTLKKYADLWDAKKIHTSISIFHISEGQKNVTPHRLARKYSDTPEYGSDMQIITGKPYATDCSEFHACLPPTYVCCQFLPETEIHNSALLASQTPLFFSIQENDKPEEHLAINAIINAFVEPGLVGVDLSYLKGVFESATRFLWWGMDFEPYDPNTLKTMVENTETIFGKSVSSVLAVIPYHHKGSNLQRFQDFGDSLDPALPDDCVVIVAVPRNAENQQKTFLFLGC